MTSANITEYTIRNLGGVKIGEYSQHALCYTHWGDLLKFQPLEDYTIQPWGYDEEEEYWEGEETSLKVFIDKLKVNKHNFWTSEDIKNGLHRKEK
jgi:predicted glutamine amidotransferase